MEMLFFISMSRLLVQASVCAAIVKILSQLYKYITLERNVQKNKAINQLSCAWNLKQTAASLSFYRHLRENWEVRVKKTQNQKCISCHIFATKNNHSPVLYDNEMADVSAAWIVKTSAYHGNNVGSQDTLVKADTWGQFILANSVTPPDFDNHPTGSTFQRISSLQKSTWRRSFDLYVNQTWKDYRHE